MAAHILKHLDSATEHLGRGNHDAALFEIEQIEAALEGLTINQDEMHQIEERIRRLRRVAEAVMRGVRHAIEQIRSAAELSMSLHAYDQAGNKHRTSVEIRRADRF